MIASTSQTDVSPVLNHSHFFIKNAVKALEAKTSDKYDIYDPASREVLLQCRESNLSGVTKLRRLAGGKYDAGAPFNLIASIPGSTQQVFRVARNVPFLSLKPPPIEYYDHDDMPMASLRKKFFCLGRKFPIFTSDGSPLFELNAKSILNGFRLMAGKNELGTLWLRWKGAHADYFNQGFKYALSIHKEVPEGSGARQLLLGFALCFDRIKT